MINEISRKIERLANEYQISISRVDKILEIIKDKTKKHQIEAYFVSRRELNYNENDGKLRSIQINILTKTFHFEISLREKEMFYDIAKLEDMGMIQQTISQERIILYFYMKITNQYTKITTENCNEFKELKNFASIYEKMIFKI